MLEFIKRARDRARAFMVDTVADVVLDALHREPGAHGGSVSFETYDRVRVEWHRAFEALRGIDLLVRRARRSGSNTIAASEIDQLIRQGLTPVGLAGAAVAVPPRKDAEQ